MIRRLSALLLVAGLVAGAVAPATAIAREPARSSPDKVVSKSDHARTKIHPTLLKQLDSGSTKEIHVFVTVLGDPAAVEALLSDTHVASARDAALVVGKVHAQTLPKLAGARGVVAVNPIEFKQTGKPLGSPDPEVGKRPTAEALNKALRGLYADEVPYSEAPPLAGSNFEALKELALLDAKTHNFAEAWEAGYTGTGTTVGVLDGGTDFGHPDLIGPGQRGHDGRKADRAGQRDDRVADGLGRDAARQCAPGMAVHGPF